MAKIQRIVIHCTATPQGRDYTTKQILGWFLNPPPQGRGWNRPGYHFIIHLDGRVEQIHPIPTDGMMDSRYIVNGAKGYNEDSLHIAYIGGTLADAKTPADTRTPQQRAALRSLAHSLRDTYGIPHIVGHRDLPNVKKACPCFKVTTEL